MIPHKVYLADWVLPVAQPPLKRGAVAVDGLGKITYVGPRAKMPDCGDVVEHRGALLPGLVNAHTHLEFSDIRQPLGEPGMEFTQWISEVVGWRIKHGVDKAKAIASGIEESREAGVVAIGEIASLPVDASHYVGQEGILIHAFQEILGADESEYEQKFSQLRGNIKQFEATAVVPAISPHAPYSVPPVLLDRLMEQAEEFGHAVAMHLAETIAEREFVEHRGGPFLEMLEKFGVWRRELYQAPDSILGILHKLSRSHRSLVIHGNYLNATELDYVSSVKERMSIVFCPRTHRYFGHQAYPIDAILERGINLAIGTDSRASNPDLNLLNELKEIRQRFPDLSSEVILEMGTRNGARALGVADRLGTIEIGKLGQFCQVTLDDPNDPMSWIG